MGYVQTNICASATYMLLTLCSFFDHLCKCLSIASHSKHIKTESMFPPVQSTERSQTPFACPNKITDSYQSSTLIFAAVKPFTARFFLIMTSELNLEFRHF